VASRKTPAIAIALRGLVALASRPHRAIKAATVALLVIDHADRVRATRLLDLVKPVSWRIPG